MLASGSMKIDGFRPHHIGWAVPDLEEASRPFFQLGYKVDPETPDVTDASFGVRLRFLRLANEHSLIELIAPVTERNAVRSLLVRSGPGPYHMAYCVDNLSSSGAYLRSIGFCPVGQPQPAPAFAGREIQFFHHLAIGLIELIAWPKEAGPNA